jgi:HK97 family phage portal protein
MATILSRLRRFAGAERTPVPSDIKASRAGPLIAIQSQGRAVWTPRDYAGFAREGFQANPVAHRCVRLLAEATSSVPMDVASPDPEVVKATEALLRTPNPRQAGAAFFEALAIQLVLSGNAYVECVELEGRPRELYVLRADRMRVVPGPDGWPEAYEYRVGERVVRFASAEGPSPILHLMRHHPVDDHYGLSPMETAGAAIDIHNEASRWNKALLDNAARPSGALVYAAGGQNMTDEQYERLRRELEDGFQGAANAGRPLLLEGGLDWKPLSLTPKEMDFIELKNVAAREIALAFGVPPLVLGLAGDSTHANYAEANRVFWRQSVAPLVTQLAQGLAAWLGGHFGTELTLTPNYDGVDALHESREPLWAAVTKADFITVNEKREALGFAPLDATGLAALAGTSLAGATLPQPGALTIGSLDQQG